MEEEKVFLSKKDKIIYKLECIQQELKAPKNQYNSYGGFDYRSCEDMAYGRVRQVL